MKTSVIVTAILFAAFVGAGCKSRGTCVQPSAGAPGGTSCSINSPQEICRGQFVAEDPAAGTSRCHEQGYALAQSNQGVMTSSMVDDEVSKGRIVTYYKPRVAQ